MNIKFDFLSAKCTDFSFGLDTSGDSRSYVVIPADKIVRKTLVEMAKSTDDRMQEITTEPLTYEPLEKYEGQEHLTLPVNESMVKSIKDLHEANNLPEDIGVLDNSGDWFAYFARFTDKDKQRLTAVKRTTQFKGLLKKQKHLIRWFDNSMRTVEDDIFQFDMDFDFLMDSETVHILRPSGLVFIAQLQEEIMKSVPSNIKIIEQEINYVNFAPIELYAKKHPLAARYIASIRSRSRAKNVNQELLVAYLKEVDVAVQINDEKKIEVTDKGVMKFLGVLDRRIYPIELEEGKKEIYRAVSRTEI